MKSGLRAGAVAVAMTIASYGVIATSHQAAAAPPAAVPQQSAQEPPTEVKAADTKTTLPAGSVADVLVDDAHDQVFVSMPSNNSVVVTNLDGAITGTITGLNKPREMVLSPDGSTVYATEENSPTLAKIDTQTHEVTHASLPDTDCVRSLTFAGGKLWYSYRTCADPLVGGVGVFDPADGSATSGVFSAQSGTVRALNDRPDRLFLVSHGELHVYDVSSDSPTIVKEAANAGGYCPDAVLIAGGDKAVSACGSQIEHKVYATSDLSSAPPLDTDPYPNAVAVSADGRFVAAGSDGWGSSRDIMVYNVQGDTPTLVRSYTFTYYSKVVDSALAFGGNGRLYAVQYESSQRTLHVLHDATKFDSSITLDAPAAVKHQETVNATGTLHEGPGVETVLALSRTDRTGAHEMGTITTAADGTFSFTHTPDVTGPVTYTVAYAGDADHTAAHANAKVVARPLPYDINADGYAETVVGVPGENIGSDTNTGMFHVLFGGAAGTTGSGSKSYHQDTSGVPGSGEDGDQFGWTNTSGDFNGDGYADVAVAANAENIGSSTDAGMVLVFYGSASGLLTSGVTSLYHSYTELFLGQSLAAGDFDGDGRDDLAVGGPGSYSGDVYVYPGSDAGLSRTNYRQFSQDTGDVPGDGNHDDLFGWSLATGDVNGDGRAELAVGAIFDSEDRGWSTGSTTVLYGSASGLNIYGAQRLSKDTPGVPGQPRGFNDARDDWSDDFGHQVALADVNGDGKADLTATAPGAPVWVDGVRKRDAGTASVLYSDGSRITGSGSKQLSQQTSGMPGTSGKEDYFGATMASGDSDGNGIADLAIFSPGDTYVTVVRGGSSGPNTSTAKGWTQNSSGIPGSSEKGDYWGNSLRFADIKGTGHHALIVGADGENSGKGSITVIYSTSSGLTGSGAKYFSQNSTGISGTAENGDWFGSFY